jgi:hypothetical protein
MQHHFQHLQNMQMQNMPMQNMQMPNMQMQNMPMPQNQGFSYNMQPIQGMPEMPSPMGIAK